MPGDATAARSTARALGRTLAATFALGVGCAVAVALAVLTTVPSARGQTRPTHERAAESPTAGVTVERHRLPYASPVGIGDRIATLVRVDPRRYAFRFLGEGHEGARRPLDAWVRDFSLAGGINAGMFMPNGRSVGFMMQDGAIRSNRRPRTFDAAIGIGGPGARTPLAIGGPGCEGSLARFERTFGTVLQTRKLLVDCEGRARPWDNRRRYSMSAFGVDREGRAVLVHVRTPYRMEDLARMLAAPELGLRGLAYMEGGPEASVVVHAEGVRVREMGSYEDGFNPNDDNRALWDLPNIIGFAPR